MRDAFASIIIDLYTWTAARELVAVRVENRQYIDGMFSQNSLMVVRVLGEFPGQTRDDRRRHPLARVDS